MTIAAVAVCWFAIGAAVAVVFGRLCRWADRDYLPTGVERVKHPLPEIPAWANAEAELYVPQEWAL